MLRCGEDPRVFHVIIATKLFVKSNLLMSIQRRHFADVRCAFKVHIGLVLGAHLLVYHEVKTTSSPDMISVTRPCADHPIKAHEFVLEHV